MTMRPLRPIDLFALADTVAVEFVGDAGLSVWAHDPDEQI